MISDLETNQLKLAEYMSQISEEAYSAGWMEGLEYALWTTLVEGPKTYGRKHISENEIKILKDLSSLSGGWIYFDNEKEESFVNMENWLKMYNQNISKYENKIS